MALFIVPSYTKRSLSSAERIINGNQTRLWSFDKLWLNTCKWKALGVTVKWVLWPMLKADFVYRVTPGHLPVRCLDNSNFVWSVKWQIQDIPKSLTEIDRTTIWLSAVCTSRPDQEKCQKQIEPLTKTCHENYFLLVDLCHVNNSIIALYFDPISTPIHAWVAWNSAWNIEC